MTQPTRSNFKTGTLLAAMIAGSLGLYSGVANAQVATQDQLSLHLGSGVATGTKPSGSKVPIAGFQYDSTSNSWWTIGFSSDGQIRKLVSDGNGGYKPAKLSYTNDFTGGYVYPTDWTGFISTTDLQNGTTNYDWRYTNPFAGNMLLNPKAITVGGKTYEPNTVAVINQSGGALNRSSVNTADTKVLYLYDLRQVGATQEAGGRDLNNNGVIDWQDVFIPIVNKNDMNLAAGKAADYAESSLMLYQQAWSTDGQTVYTVDGSTKYGGVYATNITTGNMQRIFVADTSTTIKADISVLHSQTKNLTGSGYVGDQLLVKGSTASGNIGGLDVLINDDPSNNDWSSYSLISHEAFSQFLELKDGKTASVLSTATDSDGNIYIVETTTDAVYKLDTKGRLAKLASEREIESFQQANGASSPSSSSLMDLQARNVSHTFATGNADVVEVLYSDPKLFAPVGIKAFKTGDFNRDNIVDQSDIALFKNALGLRGTTGTDATEKFDLNGNAIGSNSKSNTANSVVDYKDVKILQQFYAFNDGDADMDQQVDFSDATTLVNHYGQGSQTWVGGDFNGDDTVNFTDATILVNNYGSEAKLADPLVKFDSANAAHAMTAAIQSVPQKIVRLIVDLTNGEISLQGNSTISGFAITSSNGSLIADADHAAFPFTLYWSNTANEIAASSLTGGVNINDNLVLDAKFDISGLQDLDFRYALAGQTDVAGQITYIPEPATLGLLLLSSLAFSRASRKSA